MCVVLHTGIDTFVSNIENRIPVVLECLQFWTNRLSILIRSKKGIFHFIKTNFKSNFFHFPPFSAICPYHGDSVGCKSGFRSSSKIVKSFRKSNVAIFQWKTISNHQHISSCTSICLHKMVIHDGNVQNVYVMYSIFKDAHQFFLSENQDNANDYSKHLFNTDGFLIYKVMKILQGINHKISILFTTKRLSVSYETDGL